MRKIVIRSECDRYNSAIMELTAIGTDSEWLYAVEESDQWYHNIVCAIRYNTITPHMFAALDEKPSRWPSKKDWHWKLRRCRNHPQWSAKLFDALRENEGKTMGDER